MPVEVRNSIYILLYQVDLSHKNSTILKTYFRAQESRNWTDLSVNLV